ncbi:MAG TPA: phage integrase SAM-like domain-containing protein [Bacteroidales bacterium]|nr:phage integrase SAM-like domain-containing protein [Bacteroidales bacterium]
MAYRIIFKLKEPQKGKSLAKQKPTPVNLFFSYGYSGLKNDKRVYIPLKYSTGLSIKPQYWLDRPTYRAKNTVEFESVKFNNRLNQIEDAIRKVFEKEIESNRFPDPDQLRGLLSQELKRKVASAPISLNEYLKKFIEGIKSGQIETEKRTKFTYDTIRSFEGLKQQFDKFQTEKRKVYNFHDITLDFYDEFVRFFNDKDYSPNTIGKHLKTLKIIMHRAKDAGLHTNTEVDRKKFKVINSKVQEIYLTESDIKKLIKINLVKDKLFDSVRDVFLVGYFTAQRFSDYSRIRKEHIRKLDTGGKVIDLIQQKTGERIIVPIRPELEKILKKNKYELPRVLEQKVNKHIKTIAWDAGIKETVLIERTRGGLKTEVSFNKADLIKTHTARRSGATNLYLAGIPTIDIMKLTGHKTEKEFMKYILVSKEQTAINLLKQPYFNKHLKIAK